MRTVPRVLVRGTASPAHADFGGLSSLAALVVVRLVVVRAELVSRRRRRPTRRRASPAPLSVQTVAGCRLG